jgi:hypothetical protein
MRNKKLIHGTNDDYKRKNKKLPSTKETTTTEGTKICYAEQMNTTWRTKI